MDPMQAQVPCANCLLAYRLQMLEDDRSVLPPRRWMDVVVIRCRPTGPVGGVKRDNLLGLRNRDHGQVLEPELHGLVEEVLDLWIAQGQRADFVDDLAVRFGVRTTPAPGIVIGAFTDR